MLAFLLVFALKLLTGDLIFMPTLVAILIAAWYGGTGPGLLTLAVVLALSPTLAVLPSGAAHTVPEYLTAVLTLIPFGLLTVAFGHQGRRAISSLRRSEHLFDAFMANLPGAAWMKDTNGRYAYANDEALRIFGTPRESLYGKRDAEIFSADTARQFIENDQQALTRRDAVQTVEALEHADGIHQSLVVKFPVLDGRRATEFVGGIAIDITDRYRAEQDLAERSEQLQLLIDAVPALVSYVDQQRRYVFNSKTYEDWFGRPASEIQGQRVEDVIGPEAYEDVRPHLERALAGEVVEYEALVRYLDGGSRWIEAQYVPDRGRDGSVIGVFALILDVTARKRDQLERTLLARVSEHLTDSLHMEDAAGRLVSTLVPDFVDGAGVYFASEGDRSSGISLSRSGEGGPESAMYFIDPDELRGVGAVLRTGRAEHYRQAPDGLALPARATPAAGRRTEAPLTSLMIVPIVAGTDVVGAIAAWTDESRRVCGAHEFEVLKEIARRAGVSIHHSMLYEESVRTAEELRVANNAKDEFLGLVSHELRTPITVILGNASLLANRHQQMDAETVSASLGDLLGQAERLHRVVENMLILARLESGTAGEPEPIPIARSIGQVIAEAQRQQAGRVIRLESSDWDLFAVGVESYVHQVALNYVNNAMRYSDPAEPVDIAVRSEAGEVRVTVLDRGIGLSDEDLAGIFKPFYRSTRVPGETQGMGIGLSVSKRLIEALGGSVWAAPREGGGSEFGFALPVATARDPGELELAQQPAIEEIPGEGGAHAGDLHNA